MQKNKNIVEILGAILVFGFLIAMLGFLFWIRYDTRKGCIKNVSSEFAFLEGVVVKEICNCACFGNPGTFDKNTASKILSHLETHDLDQIKFEFIDFKSTKEKYLCVRKVLGESGMTLEEFRNKRFAK